MNILKTFLLPIAIMTYSCDGQTLEQRRNNNNMELKSTFDLKLTSHFPTKITVDNGQENSTIANTDEEKNKIGLYLYQYDVPEDHFDLIKNDISKTKFIGKYNTNDTCLFVVNRFESPYTSENVIIPEITDSSLIDRDCYDQMLPVPNFVNYTYYNRSTSCGLDSSFVIYVLEAKPGKHFPKFDTKPFVQMPSKWANGYSKGIAISDQNRTVIYWSIIW